MTDPMQTDLHSRIMNLPCKYQAAWDRTPSEWIEGYVNGHRDTRHAAAELANEYASELRSLRDALALAKSRIAELEGAALSRNGLHDPAKVTERLAWVDAARAALKEDSK